MRIIPKNSKMKNTVWKQYSIKDIVIAFCVMIFIFLVCLSNMPGKFIIAIAIGLVSIILFMPTGINGGLFYSEVFAMIKHLFSQKKFTKEKEIDRLMPFTGIREDGVIEYDGYFGKVIEIGQKEFAIEDEYQQDIDINQLAIAFKYLDDGQTVDLVKIDRPVNFDIFASEVWEKMHKKIDTDDVKREIIRRLIFEARLEQIDRINNENKIYCPFYYFVIYDTDENSFSDCVESVYQTLQTINLSPKYLSASDVAVFLKYCYTRNFDERDIANIEPEDYVKWIKPKQVSFELNKYRLDDVDCFTYAVADYPGTVGNAWGAKLFDIDNTKVVMSIKPIDQYKAVKRIDAAVNELASKSDLGKASEMLEQDTHIASLGTLLENLQNDNESLYDVTTTVTRFCYEKDQTVFAARKKLRQELSTQGLIISNLFSRQIDGFLQANISKRESLTKFTRGINSTSLAAVFPFVHTDIMEKGGVLFGTYNECPLILDVWKRSSDYTNSNMMIIGKPGAGKSYFSKLFLANEWAQGSYCFVLDPEAEYLTLARNVQGTIIDVGNATEGRINPFHLYDVLTENGEKASSSVIFASHLKFLESFYKVIMPECDSDVLELINNATVEVYKQKGIDEYTDCSSFKAEQFPVFEDLYNYICAKLKSERNALFKNNLLRAEMYLKKFTSGGGRYSNLWNGPSTLLTSSDFVVFNFQGLFANKNNVVANAQMLLVFKYLEQQIINIREMNASLKDEDIRHVIAFADEAHLFIDKQCPVAVDFFYQMNKRIRKYFGSFIPATQNISDWNATEELRNKTSVIIKNSQYNFVFGLSKMDMRDLSDVFGGNGSFNDEETYLITSAQRGQTFFIGSARQRAFCNIIAHGFVRTLFEQKLDITSEDIREYENIRNS